MVSTEDTQKRAGLVSWLPRPGKEKGFVLWEAWGGGSLTHGSHPLCLGRVLHISSG